MPVYWHNAQRNDKTEVTKKTDKNYQRFAFGFGQSKNPSPENFSMHAWIDAYYDVKETILIEIAMILVWNLNSILLIF